MRFFSHSLSTRRPGLVGVLHRRTIPQQSDSVPSALISGILALLLSMGLGISSLSAQTPAAPDPHGAHASHASHGATATTNAPPPAAGDFIKLDPTSPKTVLLTLVSSYNAANYGMNFNGFAKGGAHLLVPKDWTVTVHFRNQSPVPHSVIVVERPMVKKLQMGQSAFKGASSPDPVRGSTGPAVTFSFVADEPGDYAIACGFPAHAANGHWIGFEVSDTASAPSLRHGKTEPYTPK